MKTLEFSVGAEGSAGPTLAFPKSRFLIGSSPECELRFGPKLVQGRHAEVSVDEQGRAWVKDLTGAGQVWVDGAPTLHAVLKPGAALRLGLLELRLRSREQSGRPAGSLARSTTPTQIPMPRQATPRASSTPHRTASATDLGRVDEAEEGEETIQAAVITPGTVIDHRYRVVKQLATGGMGEVYKVEHIELGKTFALKVMKATLSGDPDFAARFKREAMAASRIGHQSIVDISDFGQTETGCFYFVMEYLDGETLGELSLAEGALPAARAVELVVQVARALSAAHALGIIHRDLKPDNVMVLQRPGQPDLVKVLDFGMAKVSAGKGSAHQTSAGAIMGTPQYMSPEQATGVPADARSDVYSLGLILHELLCGRPTFTGATSLVLIVSQVNDAPPPLALAPGQTVPQELEELLFRMLAKKRDDRPPSMGEVVLALEALPLEALPKARARSRAHASTSTPARASPGRGDSTSDLASLKRRSPVVWGVAALALVAAVALALLLTATPAPAPNVPTAPLPRVEQVPTAGGLAGAPKPAPPPARYEVTLTSVPERVEVFEGAALIGVTPLKLVREERQHLELRFALKGYKDEVRKVVVSGSAELPITLERLSAAAAQPALRPRAGP